jgi:hypothetical protein
MSASNNSVTHEEICHLHANVVSTYAHDKTVNDQRCLSV